jgi:glutamine amidotransferase
VIDVVVLDYGSGNLCSAQRALEKVGASVDVSSDPDRTRTCDALVVPGVGALAACMAGIRKVGADRVIDQRLAGGRPVLGICVGMQVMFERGDEHGVRTECLDQWPGEVERLDAPVLPHMGWDTVNAAPESRLFTGLEGAYFTFVHSYAARRWIRVDRYARPVAVTTCDFGGGFLAAVEDGPLCATQFHPEKSGDAGLTLLENWVGTIRDR